MTESNKTAYAPGARVVVTDEYGEYLGTGTSIKAGTTLVVTSCWKSVASGYQVGVALPTDFDGPDPVVEIGEFGSDWFVPAKGIPFALTKDTSKAYATKQASRSLEDQHNEVLRAAGRGEEVDAVAFRKAVTAALSLAATRAGQSMARRDWTRECRHLLYIVDAVIDNALAGLPPVEPGQRSPKIREQEREIAVLRREKQQAENALGLERERTDALIQEKSDLELLVDQNARSADGYHAALVYALRLLGATGKQQAEVLGYRIGFLAGRGDA